MRNIRIKNLSDLVNDFLLESSTSQIVQEFTRSEIVQGNQVSASCIDHYYTNVPNKMAQPDVCATGTSDNLGVVVTKFIKVNNKGPQTIKKRCYRLFDIESFLSDILNSRLNEIIAGYSNLDDAAKCFKKALGLFLTNSHPLRLYRCGKTTPLTYHKYLTYDK